MTMVRRLVARMAAIAGAALVSGCEFDVLDPAGRVGVAEKTLITTSTLAMLLVVVPVIVLTLFFAFRYRASGGTGAYRPKWAHSKWDRGRHLGGSRADRDLPCGAHLEQHA